MVIVLLHQMKVIGQSKQKIKLVYPAIGTLLSTQQQGKKKNRN